MNKEIISDKRKYRVKNFDTMVDNNGIGRCTMYGVTEDLKEIKTFIEKKYQDVFYMGYDMEYHGWDGIYAQNVRLIQSKLQSLFEEIYVVCEAGLNGEDVDILKMKNDNKQNMADAEQQDISD